MSLIEKEIEKIQEEISKTKKNKATERHIGRLYGRIASLRKKQEAKRSKGSGKKASYAIGKTGDATAVLVGFPSVGKSTLINSLTNAQSQVAAYDFTTLMPIPGMMKYKEANIQIIDLPGIISKASRGRGRGREILSVVRNADIVVIVLSALKPEHLPIIKKELFKAGIRLDKKPPRIIFKKKSKGGIKVLSTKTLTKLTPNMIKEIMRAFGHSNAEVIIKDNISDEEFIDALLGNRHYVKSMLVFNKTDKLSKKKLKKLKKQYKNALFISAKEKKGLEKLKKEIFERTKIIRVYLKPKGELPDKDKPIILHKGDTIYDLAVKIHKNFAQYFRYAQVWGPSAKFPAQKLGLNHELKDGDIVTIVI